MIEKAKWNITAEEGGVKLKVNDVLKKEDVQSLIEALERSIESLVGIEDKKLYPHTNISMRRLSYGTENIVPTRVQKKRETRKGPY